MKNKIVVLLILFWGFSYSQKIDSIAEKRTDKVCVFLSYGKKSEPRNLLNYIKKTEYELYHRIKKATTSYELKIDSISYYCVYLGKKNIPYNKIEELRNKPIRYHLIEYSYLSDGKREKTYLIDEK